MAGAGHYILRAIVNLCWIIFGILVILAILQW